MENRLMYNLLWTLSNSKTYATAFIHCVEKITKGLDFEYLMQTAEVELKREKRLMI